MNSWVKKFSDGTKEIGSDNAVEARKASWRHGRLDGLVAVDLCMDNRLVTLKASEGEWWQADDYIAHLSPGTSKGELVARRAMYKLSEQDAGKWVVAEITQSGVTISIEDEKR
jgi:hypothetical protein